LELEVEDDVGFKKNGMVERLWGSEKRIGMEWCFVEWGIVGR
jgi:hypothetical protein